MQDLNNNNNAQEQVKEEVNTTQKTSKEVQAEQFLKSLEQNKKQVKSKTISFKCNLEDYTLIRSKAILNNVSIAEYITDLAKKDKKKAYKDLQAKIDNLLSKK